MDADFRAYESDSQHWARLELPDLHYSAAYARVQETMGGKAIMLGIFTPMGWIAQPFIKRSTPYDDKHFDFCSPFGGYGGPVSNIVDADDRADIALRFDAMLREWCKANNIVSEFCYLHPLLQQADLLPEMKFSLVRHVVIVELQTNWRERMSKRVRRAMKHAYEQSHTFQNTAGVLTQPWRAEFAKLYTHAMDLKKAGPHWRLSASTLEAHYDYLGAELFKAYGRDDGTRMLMVMSRGDTAYAHLLGSDGNGMRDGLDEFLYVGAAERLALRGLKYFHIGGGLSGDPTDQLLFFKSGFARPKHWLCSYRRIFDEAVYDDLAHKKKVDEMKVLGRVLDTDFFPAYRRVA